MPIYEYICSACQHRTDILHGINDEGPAFCPNCGAEGTLRKAFAPPAIHFKGSGWAKKERRSAVAAKPSSSGDKADTSDSADKSGLGASSDTTSESKAKAEKASTSVSDKGE